MLKLKGTTVFPAALKEVLDGFAGISAYVIVARRGPGGADAVEVRFACRGDKNGARRGLRERFQGAIKVAPELTFATITEIETLQMPEGARKRRYFVDHRPATECPA